MSEMPYIRKTENDVELIVDGKPFVVLGGELHNSSGSDLKFMEEHVWPGLKELGGNCYLTPVYWEHMEPEPGKFDFSLVDGVIRQAREAEVRLILLWFGLWKNGKSEYAPAWVKKNPDLYYMVNKDGKMLESVSPFCHQAVELDKAAYVKLMEHLKKYDPQHTVIMMQVENEIGVWENPRDFCETAQSKFKEPVPADMLAMLPADATAADGDRADAAAPGWQEAYGDDAGERFMGYAFAKAVEEIASAGKAVYPLPTFMNTVAIGVPLPARIDPCGAPIPRTQPVWKAFAPSVDLYGPDLYSPFFKALCNEYSYDGYLIIPECGQGKDSAPKALYTLAGFNTLIYSPFGIDGLANGISVQDLLSQTDSDLGGFTGQERTDLAESYWLIRTLYGDIKKARTEGRLFAFYQQDTPEVFETEDYTITVEYGCDPTPGPFGRTAHRPENAPDGGGFILRDGDSFLVCGYSAKIKCAPKDPSKSMFILDKCEYSLTETGLKRGRTLNGDERNNMILGPQLSMQRVTLYLR